MLFFQFIVSQIMLTFSGLRLLLPTVYYLYFNNTFTIIGIVSFSVMVISMLQSRELRLKQNKHTAYTHNQNLTKQLFCTKTYGGKHYQQRHFRTVTQLEIKSKTCFIQHVVQLSVILRNTGSPTLHHHLTKSATETNNLPLPTDQCKQMISWITTVLFLDKWHTLP